MRLLARPRVLLPMLGCFFLLILLFHSSDAAMDGVRQGLSLCLETLIPSLFPFLVVSELMVRLGAGEVLGKLIGRPLRAVLGLSDAGTSSLLLGTLCGFPVGSTTAITLYNEGRIDKKELDRLTLFCNNPSSGFLISAVGIALFGSRAIGVAIFCITVLSALLTGMVLRIGFGKAESGNIPANGVKKRVSATDFTQSVRNAFSSLATIVAFVLFFSCTAHCLRELLSPLGLSKVTESLLFGVLEMTAGIAHATATLAPPFAFRLVVFFASFSGISVALQLFCIGESVRLRLSAYLLTKCLQAGIALLLAEGYLRFFHPHLGTVKSVQTLTPRASLNTFCVIILWLGVILLLDTVLVKIKKSREKRL